jgi:triacylglycerol esterase/lipase EstA (alpha/beta hydrolase family)
MTAALLGATLAVVPGAPLPTLPQVLTDRVPRAASTVLATLGVTIAAILAGCGGEASRTHSAPPVVTQTAPHAAAPQSPAPTASVPSPPASPSSAGGPPPPTVVNSNCRPPAQHPEPIILVPGTYGATAWTLIAPQLAQLGYCVHTFTYGADETGDIPASAQELARFVAQLLTRTGARRVSIVGHSEGGMMPRYYVKFLGGEATVDKLVALAPSNHGTLNPATFGGAVTGCVACTQQQAGSAFLTHLNAGAETPPPVDYTVIETMYDEVVVPYASAFLSGPAARVTNVTLQQRCPTDIVGHLGITTDPVALQWVENALGGTGPANPGYIPVC